jgi:glyoxylase-like metal-dependent hydrolase (beta-lactamase superfamily II)
MTIHLLLVTHREPMQPHLILSLLSTLSGASCRNLSLKFRIATFTLPFTLLSNPKGGVIMALKITSAGNAGVFVDADGVGIYIDAFFHHLSHVGGAPAFRGAEAGKADLILVTHSHYDHLHPDELVAAALATGAPVAGPADAIALVADRIPADKLTALEAPERKRPPESAVAEFGKIRVTAFRTYHGRGHNSYLVEVGKYRILHDADNERTQPYDMNTLGRIDALFLCPWQGSGAGEFVARLNPGKWFLIHMTPEEIDQHRAGAFLPPLVAPVPPGVVALRGGEVFEL